MSSPEETFSDIEIELSPEEEFQIAKAYVMTHMSPATNDLLRELMADDDFSPERAIYHTVINEMTNYIIRTAQLDPATFDELLDETNKEEGC